MSRENLDVRVISVLRSFGEAAGKTELRIVSWNGKEPVLEKRQFVTDRVAGGIRPGKCRGFSLNDVGYLVSNWPNVQRLMLDADQKNAKEIYGE